MKTTRISLPDIPEEQRTPLVNMLLKIIDQQQFQIEALTGRVNSLESEIKRLKKHNQKPKIKPSKMDKGGCSGGGQSNGKRAGSQKRKKTDSLPIHKTETIKATNVPPGARFKGYHQFTVQDIEIKVVNTLYELERWRLPNGEYITAELPAEIAGHHFGPTLRTYILHQYHHQGVTEPLLLEELREWRVDISSGQLNRILIEDKDCFHEEKDALLETGLQISSYIHVDDTGARHKGKNGYCTHIGNDLFAWFESTASKSRINFLELLRGSYTDYYLNMAAFDYMQRQRLPLGPLQLLSADPGIFQDAETWFNHLSDLGIENGRHWRIATEGALIGGILAHGFNIDLSIISDDAGQFNIFQHALCWIHAERKINGLIPLNDQQATAIEEVREKFWALYGELKSYKKSPTKARRTRINKQFDELFTTRTCFELLNQALKRLRRNKPELLLVLDHPGIPLHNNLSERDIREYVKRRKVSGSTRSDEGRRCRDTFASLKKTCKKLGVKFWDYLQDRIEKKNAIPELSVLMRQAAADTG